MRREGGWWEGVAREGDGTLGGTEGWRQRVEGRGQRAEGEGRRSEWNVEVQAEEEREEEKKNEETGGARVKTGAGGGSGGGEEKKHEGADKEGNWEGVRELNDNCKEKFTDCTYITSTRPNVPPWVCSCYPIIQRVSHHIRFMVGFTHDWSMHVTWLTVSTLSVESLKMKRDVLCKWAFCFFKKAWSKVYDVFIRQIR